MTLPDRFFELAKLQNPGKNDSQLWQEADNALDLSERRLAFADFSNAQMPHSNFKSAKLPGAIFVSANLQGVNLGCTGKVGGLDFRTANLQDANLSYAQLQGALLIKTQLKGVVLSDSKQLESSWTRGLGWEQDYDFTQLKTESWAQPEAVQQHFEEAQQRLKAFKPPQLPPPINRVTFVTHWLGLMCQDADVTKAMLQQLGNLFVHSHPISEAQAQQYLDSHKECAPYRTILEN